MQEILSSEEGQGRPKRRNDRGIDIDGYTDDRSLGYSISSIWDCEPIKNCPACRISPAFFKISGVQSDVSIRTKSSDRRSRRRMLARNRWKPATEERLELRQLVLDAPSSSIAFNFFSYPCDSRVEFPPAAKTALVEECGNQVVTNWVERKESRPRVSNAPQTAAKSS